MLTGTQETLLENTIERCSIRAILPFTLSLLYCMV